MIAALILKPGVSKYNDCDCGLYQQDSKQGSYLDDDGESVQEAAASDITQASSAHSTKITADGMVVTKV